MKKILLFVGMIPALCAGLLCACATTKTDIKQLEGKWTITAVNGEKIQTEEPPFLEFNLKEMRVHGNTGCNIFNATFKQEDEKDASSLVFNHDGVPGHGDGTGRPESHQGSQSGQSRSD